MTWERATTLNSENPSQRALPSLHLHLLFSSSGASQEPRPLTDGNWTLGRSTAADAICVIDPRVSRAHAQLRVSQRGQCVELVDQSSNGCFVNGERVTHHRLQCGDVLRVGDSLFLLRAPSTDRRNAAVEGLMGSAPSIMILRHDITRVAREDASVLILGESGTGKELVAQALHRGSGRKGAFVAVNCAAISESVAESLLFGHVAGAFTGARCEHDGYFRAADGGTLFLDEVGDLPLRLQPKLLRALETSSVVPVGATLPVRCQARIIAATHRDLQAEVDAGRFRGDLYARLSQLRLQTPSLRERPEDVLPILRTLIGAQCDLLPADIVEAMLVDPWPYNVRELLSTGKRIRALGAREGASELRLLNRKRSAPKAAPSNAKLNDAHATIPPAAEPADHKDVPPTREHIIAVVEQHRGNIRRTAVELGRSRKQVYRYLEQYAIDLSTLRGAGPDAQVE